MNNMNSIIESFSNFGCLGAPNQSPADTSQVDAAGYSSDPSFHIRNRAKQQLTESNQNHKPDSKFLNNSSINVDEGPSTSFEIAGKISSAECSKSKFHKYSLESQERKLKHKRRREAVFRPRSKEDDILASAQYFISWLMRSGGFTGGLCALREDQEQEPDPDAAASILLNLTHEFDQHEDQAGTSVKDLDFRHSVVESAFHSRLNYALFEEDGVEMEFSDGVIKKFRQIRKQNVIDRMQCRTDLFPLNGKCDQKLPNNSVLSTGVDTKKPAQGFSGVKKSNSPTSVIKFDDIIGQSV